MLYKDLINMVQTLKQNGIYTHIELLGMTGEEISEAYNKFINGDTNV